MGLATVITGKIHLIYPDTKHEMLSLLNGIYLSREWTGNGVRPFITIMWTNLTGWPDRSKSLNVSTPCSSHKNAEPSNWFFVHKKRKHKTAKNSSSFTCEGKPSSYSQIKPHEEKGSQNRASPSLTPMKREKQVTEDSNNKKGIRKKFKPQMPFLSQKWFETRVENNPKSRKINNKSSNLCPTMTVLSFSQQ